MTLARRHRKPKPRISYEQFWRDVTNDGRRRCALDDGHCDGPKDAHHYVPKRRIDLQLGGKHKPEAIAAKQDVRNGICLCRYHHELVETGALRSPRPELLGLFLLEHDLRQRADRYDFRDRDSLSRATVAARRRPPSS